VFLVASKVLDLLLSPFTWALLLCALALVWMQKRPRRARWLMAAALIDLLVFSIDPVARGLYGRLESGAQDTFRPDPPYDVVVVLGGIIDPVAMRRSGQIELDDAADRISQVAILLRTGQARMALLSGGNVFPQPGDRSSEASVLAEWLRDQGIAPDRLVLEERSRNTHENALESASIIAARGWKRVLLVTSAWHAPRALGCFRAAGVSPDLLTVDHRSGSPGTIFWLPRADALSSSTEALREMFGGVVYRAMGYSK
jgi:uncharacterized SAM-binding protein YcdF (DUF218 family)